MFGDNIQKFRKQQGITQAELASLLNVTVMDVSSWEDNVSKPSLDEIISISKILEVSLDELTSENSDVVVSSHKDNKKSNKKVKSKKNHKKVIIPIVIAVLLVGLITASVFLLPILLHKPFSEDTTAIHQAEASVVKIICYNYDGAEFCTGSGFIAFDDKTVVTNYHVIDDAYSAIISTETDKAYDVESVLYASEEEDIAVLQLVDPTGLTPLSLGNSHSVEKGATITTIGSPLGLKNTISQGIISGRMFENDIELLQFTASISSGSSGGALFNDNGEVIGITFASYEEGQNINLAIPVEILSQAKFDENPITIQKFCEKNNNYIYVLNNIEKYNNAEKTTFSELKSSPHRYDEKVVEFTAYVSSIDENVYFLSLVDGVSGDSVIDNSEASSNEIVYSRVIRIESKVPEMYIEDGIRIGDLVKVICKFSCPNDQENNTDYSSISKNYRDTIERVEKIKSNSSPKLYKDYDFIGSVIYKTTKEAY